MIQLSCSLRLTNTLVYYGISFNTTELAGDPYLNFTLAVVVELIAIAASHYSYEKFGRKIPYAINMSIIGVALLLVMFVPKGKQVFKHRVYWSKV